MSKLIKPAHARGLIGGARADATPNEIFGQLKTLMGEFRDEVNADLDDRFKDVVREEKIDRMNAGISDIQKALDKAVSDVAALQVGGSGQGVGDPDKQAHAKAFDKFFRRGVDAGLRDLEVQAALSTDSDPDGGYLVPEEMESGIDQIARDSSVMRQIANVQTIGTDTYKKLINMGGAGSGWVGEKEARPETSTPTLRELVFNVQEIYANPATTQKMLDDGIVDVGAWIADEVREEFAAQESEAFVSGDGVNKPRGLWSYDMVENDSYEWGKFGYVVSGKNDGFLAPTTSVSPADCLVNLVYALKATYRNGASFLMNDKTAMTVRKFKTAEGDWLWRDPSQPEDVPTILGKPVRTDDYTPLVAANAYPIAFGNFSRAYTIFDRQGIRVLRDPFTNKPYVQLSDDERHPQRHDRRGNDCPCRNDRRQRGDHG